MKPDNEILEDIIKEMPNIFDSYTLKEMLIIAYKAGINSIEPFMEISINPDDFDEHE